MSLVADPRQHEDDSVRHLVELGYVDPDEVAACQAELRSRLEADLRLAVELMGQDQAPEAVPMLDRLIVEDPNWISPRQILAEVHFRAGNSTAARPHLDWLAHHGVVTPRLAEIEGAIELERRDLPAALQDLEYASHVEPTLLGVQTLLGTTLLRLGRWDPAEDAFEKAVRQNPADTAALDGLATVALHRKHFEDAAQWALEALEHDMQLFRAHYHLGVALAHLDRTESAIEAFATCARLEPLRAAPFYWLTRIANEQRGDAVCAAEYRDRGREIIRQRRCRVRNSPPTRPST